MAIKRLKNAAKTSAKQTSDKPATIDREEMKRRLGKAKSSDKQTSSKQVSTKKTSDKQVSAKADVQEGKEMDLRTMETGLKQMLTLVMNVTKEFAEIKDKMSALEQSVSVVENVAKIQSEICKGLGDKISDLYDYVEDALEGDGDEDEDEDEEAGDYDGDDEDVDGDEDGDCEEGDEEDDCEESEEDDDEDEEEDDDEGDDDEGEDDMDLDPANYTPEDVMEILSEFDNADLKEIVDEVKERLELTRNYSLKTLLKDENRRGVILQVINEFAYDDEDEDEDEDE